MPGREQTRFRAGAVDRWLASCHWLALLPTVLLGGWVLAPYFADTRTMGFQDWDVQAAYRYVTGLSLREYGQLPWWNPWLCGGFPAWGYVEGASNLLSPFAPLYLLFPFPLALRLEVVGAFVVGAVGAHMFARQFTRSPGWCAFVVAIWMLNSRWAHQISAGHMWHLAYAWMPFVFASFNRALRRTCVWPAVAAGAFLALMIYLGGIYPYPHTVMLLGLFAATIALAERRLRPLSYYGVAVAVSLGLAAPKLLPSLETMTRVPRIIGSNEAITVSDLWSMLTTRHQALGTTPVLPISFHWVWWEWGLYLGVGGVVALVVGSVLGAIARRDAPLSGLRAAGLLCLLLAFGKGAWLAVHRLPLFSSQHIPSRLMYPGLLMLAVAMVGGLEERWRSTTRNRRWLEWTLLAAVTVYALDLAGVARQATVAPFRLQIPAIARSADFWHELNARVSYVRPTIADVRTRGYYLWPGKVNYPAMLANHGVIQCYGVPLSHRSRVSAKGTPGDRGMAFLSQGPGQARVTHWTPNRVTIAVSGASAGALLVYNMNFAPGWNAGDQPATEWQGLVAAPIGAGAQTIELRYRPPWLLGGLVLFVATALALGAAALLRWRAKPAARPAATTVTTV